MSISDIITKWKYANPIICQSLGLMEFSGILKFPTTEFQQNRISELKNDILFISQKIDRNTDKSQLFEFELILQTLKSELYELRDFREFTRNPSIWLIPIPHILNIFESKEYNSSEEKIRFLINFEKKISDYLLLMNDTLQSNLMISRIDFAIHILKDLKSHFSNQLYVLITCIEDEEIIMELSEINIRLISTIEWIINKFKNEYRNNCIDNNIMLGKKKFTELLLNREGIGVPIPELIEMGEHDLKRNNSHLKKILNKYGGMNEIVKITRKITEESIGMISKVENIIANIIKFLIKSDILSIPNDYSIEVIPTPEYMKSRFFGALNSPGVLEESLKAYLWLDVSSISYWSEKNDKHSINGVDQYFLEIFLIHEVFPGHYLQFLHARKSTSEISKIMSRSNLFIEGWAHYSEEMIIECGYKSNKVDFLKVYQLLLAILRNVRYLITIKLHSKDIDVKSAISMFMKYSLITYERAKQEVERCMENPFNINYTLGKMMIKKLRKDYKKEKGKNYSIKKFHNELLSYGTPSIIQLRKMLLDNDTGILL